MPPTAAPFICARCAKALRIPTTARALSTTPLHHQQQTTTTTSPRDIPRWKQSLPAMRMPIRLRPRPNQPVWKVNSDSTLVDETYDRFLGRSCGPNTKGREALPEEIKWLALTHKSYEHGAQGNNDRLAFLGKRIVDLQTSIALLNAPTPTPTYTQPQSPTPHHPDLAGLENLSLATKQNTLSRVRLSQLAASYGLDRVVRWKPRKSDNLAGSGQDTILAHTLYSIIGALALQNGGEVAERVARERVLGPLGLR